MKTKSRLCNDIKLFLTDNFSVPELDIFYPDVVYSGINKIVLCGCVH